MHLLQLEEITYNNQPQPLLKCVEYFVQYILILR